MTMNKKYSLYILGAVAVLFPAFPAFASEDSVPYMFGGDVNYEQLELGHAQMSKPEAPFEQGEIFGADTFDIGDETPVVAPAEKKAAPTAEGAMPPPPPAADIPMLQVPESTPAPAVQPETEVNKDSLSENFSVSADGDSNQPAAESDMPALEGGDETSRKSTWIDKLSSEAAISKIKDLSATGESLEDLVDKARSSKNVNKRSNASVFDISGLMLRMNLKQVDDIMQNRGFKKIMEKFEIPNFIKWRNEEKCRNSGVIGYERLEACVIQRAKEEKQQYTQHTKYAKYDTKEEIEVMFTSNFTDNKAYKIMYQSMASAITGNSPKAMYLYNIKVYDFWRRINRKYGVPDNKQAVTWGLGNGKPYLKAKTGELVLEDPMFRELDYTRMSREDQRYLATDLYSF